jgi:hypothetical protein
VGIIVPVEWDVTGHPQAFAISTYDEQEYLINAVNEFGRKLIRMQSKKVRVYGHLGKIVKNRRIITVTGFERI